MLVLTFGPGLVVLAAVGHEPAPLHRRLDLGTPVPSHCAEDEEADPQQDSHLTKFGIGQERLEHSEHLRAWVLTIARNVAVDTLRRTRPQSEHEETGVEDARPAYEQLASLTDGLPPKERAAVVLRYGYDLSYDQIATALDSSEDAARQAASTGVRRIRRRIA